MNKFYLHGWDKNGSVEKEFENYRKKDLIVSDVSFLPKDGKWHHFVIIKDGISEECFVDGKKIPFALLT